jgi:hypothetical protein
VHVATAPIATHAVDNVLSGDTVHAADTTAHTTADTTAHVADHVNNLAHVL